MIRQGQVRDPLVLFFSGDALDSGCDLRRIIEVGQLGQPWSICL